MNLFSLIWQVVKKNLNPVWNETLQLNVDDPTQPIRVRVMDWDRVTADDSLGGAELSVADAQPTVPREVSAVNVALL